MIKPTTRYPVFTFLVLVFCFCAQPLPLTSRCDAQSTASVQVTLDDTVAKSPVSGRLLVLFSQKASPPPMQGPNWFSPEPLFGMDVKHVAPGQTITVTDASDGFPVPLSQMPPGSYYVQAVLDQDHQFADHSNGPGNFYSPTTQVIVSTDRPLSVKLELTKTIAAPVYDQGAFAKVFSYRSQLLSDFHGRDVVDRALVLLPRSYARNPEKRYPVYYEISGFGGTIQGLLGQHRHSKISADGIDFIHVMLTGQCKWGHHVYANSATNGPRGTALTEELIPAIDRQFRTIATPDARFLGGHSSGGWSSLWLQVQNPDKFSGVWSTAPDPVDLRDWQGTNLYQPGASVFRSSNGARKPLARNRGRTMLWYDRFNKMDDALGRGGQLRSFEAVFSPLDSAGSPARCWDRGSGLVNPEIVEAWKQFDISLVLKENWDVLHKPLQGKLHIFMGTKDTFYLNRATELLAERLRGLGSDAQIEFFEGRNHFNLVDQRLTARINREMAARYRELGEH